MKKLISLFLCVLLLAMPLVSLAQMMEDENTTATGQKNLKTFTINYTDGESNRVFAVQSFPIMEGEETPRFEPLKRQGYAFAGWTPQVAQTVTEDATYTATWQPTEVLLAQQPNKQAAPIENSLEEPRDLAGDHQGEEFVRDEEERVEPEQKEPEEEPKSENLAGENNPGEEGEESEGEGLGGENLIDETGEGENKNPVEKDLDESPPKESTLAGEDLPGKNLEFEDPEEPEEKPESITVTVNYLDAQTKEVVAQAEEKTLSSHEGPFEVTALEIEGYVLADPEKATLPVELAEDGSPKPLTFLYEPVLLMNTLALGEELIPDEGLRNWIKAQLKADEITLEGLETLDYIQIFGESPQVSSLEGLQYATNLIDIYFDKQAISDVSPILGLQNLNTLRITKNGFAPQNIEKVERLTSLTSLSLGETPLNDDIVAQLAPLENLIFIQLDSTGISNITFMAGMPSLKNIYLSNNNISNIAPLSHLTAVQNLWLDGNNITDVSPLAGLQVKNSLYLQSNKISTISAIDKQNSNQLSFFADANGILDVSKVDPSVLSQAGFGGQRGENKDVGLINMNNTAYTLPSTIKGFAGMEVPELTIFSPTTSEGAYSFDPKTNALVIDMTALTLQNNYFGIAWNQVAEGINKNFQGYQWILFTPAYNVFYNANGGINAPKDDMDHGVNTNATALLDTGMTREGYTFTGWNTQAEGTSTAYQPGDEVEITGNVTLYAQWIEEIPEFTITYIDGVDGEDLFTNQVYVAAGGSNTPSFAGTPKRVGYTFTGWSPQVTKTVTGNATYTAQWAVESYTITYTDGVDGEEAFTDEKTTAKYGELTPAFKGSPRRAGYTFMGWSPQVAKTVMENATYTAQWEKVITATYMVYFEPNNGGYVAPYYNVVSGSAINHPRDPVRKGYVFTGWYREPALQTPWNFKDDRVYAAMTLYAGWKPVTAPGGGAQVPQIGDEGVTPYVALVMMSLFIGLGSYGFIKKGKKNTGR